MNTTISANPFGEPEDWKPLEDAFDRMVAECFPGDPLARYGSSITFNEEGTVDVSYNGVTKRILNRVIDRANES